MCLTGMIYKAIKGSKANKKDGSAAYANGDYPAQPVQQGQAAPHYTPQQQGQQMAGT